MPQASHFPQPPRAHGALDISFADDMLPRLREYFTQYGDAFRVPSPVTQNDIYVFSHPEHIQHVLVTHHSNYRKGIGIERVGMLLGNGIMVSEGDSWRRQRKLIQPAFHRDVIARMIEDICAANLQLLEKWTVCAVNRREIDLTQDMSDITLGIVLRAIFGDDIDTMNAATGSHPFALLTEETERNLSFAYRFRSLSAVILDCINRRRAQHLERHDLLAMLMSAHDRKSGEPMTDRQLLDEVMTLIVAGHETTASALNWLWYLLSQHPDVERRLHQELDSLPALPKTLGETARLQYTRQVIDETLRLYPPGWLLTRRSIESDNIGGYPIAPNTDIFISPYLVHRHPHYWDQPERFDPDRFTPSRAAPRNRFVYLPFSLGPRACIGDQFALVEMLVHVAALARNVRLRYVSNRPIELECRVNLRSKFNLTMQVELRKQ